VSSYKGGSLSAARPSQAFPGDPYWAITLMHTSGLLPENIRNIVGPGSGVGLIGSGLRGGITIYDRAYGSLEALFPSDETPTANKRHPYSVGYDVQYREHAGELICEYQFIPTCEGTNVTPSYFGQNLQVTKVSDLGLVNPTIRTNDWEGILTWTYTYDNVCTGFVVPDGADLTPVSGTLSVPIVREDEDISWPTNYDSSFSLGEFYLLTDSPSSITRINLPTDIVAEWGESIKYRENAGNLDSSPSLIGAFLPQLTTDQLNTVVEWQLGFSEVPTVDMRTPIRWESIDDSCFTWIDVCDKFNVKEYFDTNNITVDSGQYIIQLRASINKDALLASMDSIFLDYTNINPSIQRGDPVSTNFRLLIYPPSMYVYPSDTVTKIVSPASNSVNTVLDDIIFRVPINYKTDGNRQYEIEFIASNGTQIFTTSSFVDSSYYEQGQWDWSQNNIAWHPISADRPEFANQYSFEDGSDAESAGYIRYRLSDLAIINLADQSPVRFRIKQMDGTLLNPPFGNDCMQNITVPHTYPDPNALPFFFANNEEGAMFDGVISQRWSSTSMVTLVSTPGSTVGAAEDLSSNEHHFLASSGFNMVNDSTYIRSSYGYLTSLYPELTPPFSIATIGSVHGFPEGKSSTPVSLVSGNIVIDFDFQAGIHNGALPHQFRVDNPGIDDGDIQNSRHIIYFFGIPISYGNPDTEEDYDAPSDYGASHHISIVPAESQKLLAGVPYDISVAADWQTSASDVWPNNVTYTNQIDLPSPIDWTKPQLIIQEVLANGDERVTLPLHNISFLNPYSENDLSGVGNAPHGFGISHSSAIKSNGLHLAWSNHSLGSGINGRQPDTRIYFALALDRELSQAEKDQISRRAKNVFGADES
jgi:hypothetical protein